ncbi:MAG: hypothetical protein RIS47_433 [Bacteroidota bacterium]|jgi:cellobiose phosphorylase
MKFGFFDDDNREYVIENVRTPYPWINYLGQEDFFSLISNTSGGYSFYRDARLRRITRYRYNNVPIDEGGKYFYINDGGTIWNPGWKPSKTELDSYECRHGLGYTRITGSYNGIKTSQLSFVPVGFKGEVIQVKLTNDTDAAKSVKLFSFAEWNLWNALDDMTNFQRNYSTGEVEIEGSAIYHKTEYRERRNHYAFYSVNTPIDGFDTDRETFIGLYNSFGEPQVVKAGQTTNSVAHGWSPIASHQINVDLAAGETKSYVFVLGYVENLVEEKFIAHKVINKKNAYAMQAQFATDAQVDAELDKLKTYWDKLLSVYVVKSHDEKLNRMVNIWNAYQCMVTFNFSRSASYFESGIGRGMGFRDSNQDLVGFVHMAQDRSRERIIDIASTQFADGGAYHQYQPLTKRGNNEIGGNFNDDPMWLVFGVAAYVKESGDVSILQQLVPFDNDASNVASLFEHLRRSFYHVVENLGEHDLPLIGRADWNDCLNLNCFSTNPDESYQTTENGPGGKAESLMIAGQFVLYGNEFVRICELIGELEVAQKAKVHIKKMEDAILQHGWDGEWFIRAYDHFGNKIGSDENEEGKIFIESQGFCIMAGVGLKDGKAQKALAAVNERLFCKYGIVLNNPAYTTYHVEMGEITSYPEGYKENAGIFCHNNPWIMIAETMVGNGDRAFEYYSTIAPAYLEDISELHRTEPYVYAQMIAGKDAFKPGEAKNSFLTGTAAWNYYAITQYILGIQPDYNGLVVNPCIPKSWDGFEISRIFRGTTYKISIKNPNGVSAGVRKMLVDGVEIQGNVIPYKASTADCVVEVILG